jgi:hypothetical protein
MDNHPLLPFEITSRDSFILAFRDWRARYPLPSREVAALLGISLLRVHLYETGYFKFNRERENAVFRRMLDAVTVEVAGTA